jgi:hypothetical protein
VAGILRERPENAGGTRCLWEGSLIAGQCVGMPARSSSQITAGALFLGSWRYMNIVLWGEGVEVSVNPYAASNFQAGIVGVRAFLTADCAPTYPSAFNYASSVT